MSFNSTSILTQSLQLSDQLHTLLLTLCEDLPHRRLSPESILEACEAHQKESASLPAKFYIKRMVQFAVGSVSEVSTTLILQSSPFLQWERCPATQETGEWRPELMFVWIKEVRFGSKLLGRKLCGHVYRQIKKWSRLTHHFCTPGKCLWAFVLTVS